MHSTQLKDSDKCGFNIDLGTKWIYPTNLPVRKYQKDIVETALFHNTLVCLPTGLGKTFIAAVVMYNYYRWYPSGRIIFMATTKPLVKQQIDACYKIVGIPRDCTVEITGNVLKTNRKELWKTKRVFFVTPQVLLNDLDTYPHLGSEIKCLIVDEAHRARRNHAFCEVIKKLQLIHDHFRVLALTATPASSLNEIVTVCNNLLINKMEVRTEQCGDVIPYIHKRSFETIVLKIDSKLAEIVKSYENIIDKYVRILLERNAIQYGTNLNKGRLFYLNKEYQERNRHKSTSHEYKIIIKTFATCAILYHAHDLLIRHGMRSFLKFFEENINKPLLATSVPELRELMDEIIDYVGPALKCDKMPNGSYSKLPENCKFGHPKFYRLKDIIYDHFQKHDASSKVIIFCEYQESVHEVCAVLLQVEGVKPQTFMGQSAITQKQQLHTVKGFREGHYNTLVSTCIGEEGIDVGFVDLVVCFDISNKSSIRLIQRIGRTGRSRNGRVVVLVSEGREYQVLKDCLQERERLSSALLNPGLLTEKLYPVNPRMIPDGVTPECQEISFTPPEDNTKNNSIKKYLTSTSTQSKSEAILTNYLPKSNLYCLSKEKLVVNVEKDSTTNSTLDFGKTPYMQCNLQGEKSMVLPSKDTQILCEIMRNITYKRYNIPMPKKENNSKRKQTDLRSLFRQTSSQKLPEVDNSLDVIDTMLKSLLLGIESSLTENHNTSFQLQLDDTESKLPPIVIHKCDLSSLTAENINAAFQSMVNSTRDELNQSEFDTINDMNDSDFLAAFETLEQNMLANQKEDTDLLAAFEILEENVQDVETNNEESHSAFETLVKNVSETEINVKNKRDEDERITEVKEDNHCVASNTSSLIDNTNTETTPKDDLNGSFDLFDDTESIIEDSFIETTNKLTINESVKQMKKRKSSPIKRNDIDNHKRAKLDVNSIFDFSVFKTSKDSSISSSKEELSNTNSDVLNQNIRPGDVFDMSFFSQKKKDNSTIKKPHITANNIFDMSFLTNTKKVERNESRDSLKTSISSTTKKSCKVSRFSMSDILPESCIVKLDALKKSRLPTQEEQESDPGSVIFSSGSSLLEDLNNPINSPRSSVSDADTIILSPQSKMNNSIDGETNLPKPIPVNLDFDFETSRTSPKSPFITRRKKLMPLQDTMIDTEQSPGASTSEQKSAIKQRPNLKNLKVKGKKRISRNFVDSQAEISSDEIYSSDESIPSGADEYDKSFVDDEKRDAIDCTQMHVLYLQSTKSPIAPKRSLFKRPMGRHVDDTVMMDNDTENTYVRDSFCVGSSEEEFEEQMSILEQKELELALKLSKQDMRKVTNKKTTTKNGKWKRIAFADSDSSD